MVRREVTLLNPSQWEPTPGIRLEQTADYVVRSKHSCSVIAGPGAGKTELLAQRAMYLLSTGECPAPRRILAISFKVDAARNLKDRVRTRCGEFLARRFDSKTFDSFSKSLLDRFRVALPEPWCPTNDYQIVFPGKDDWDSFCRELESPPEELGGDGTISQYPFRDFQKFSSPRLPQYGADAHSLEQWLVFQWWRWLLKSDPSQLDFDLIRRLALLILQRNPTIVKALRLTYSHVFMDEVQDTTAPQYDLVKAAFVNSGSVLTAVGDTKQRIMGWAGAVSKIFERLEIDFGAERKNLLQNHRSNQKIVDLINHLVQRLDKDAPEIECSRKDDPVPENAIEVWCFKSQQAEAEYLASWILARVENDKLKPDDFVVLTRSRADALEERLRADFAKRGLVIRNQARKINDVAIQDLMKEELFIMIVAFLKLAFGIRVGEPFRAAQDIIGQVMGTDIERERDVARMNSLIRSCSRGLARTLGAASPELAGPDEILRIVLDHVSDKQISRAFPQYRQGDYFETVLASLREFFEECWMAATNWPEIVDTLEGRGQVHLMTIHKSKGLEYDTVLFVDLHDSSWFGFQGNQQEETNSFFVALSRAKERIYFSASEDAGHRHQIHDLYQALEDFGLMPLDPTG